MNNYQNLSWDDIKMMYAEIAQLMKVNEQEFKQDLKKTRAETNRSIKESRQSTKEIKQLMRETKLSIKDTDRIVKENALQMKEYGKRLDNLGKQLGGVSNSNGDMAEEYFYNTLRRDKTFVNEKFDTIRQNVCYGEDEHDPEIECDIVMTNGKNTALIEVKYNAKYENVQVDKLISRAKFLKEETTAHKNHNIYLGVAAMAFNKKLAKELRQAGIATIHHVGKKMIVYDKDVKAF
jgi:hypothetical protein